MTANQNRRYKANTSLFSFQKVVICPRAHSPK